MEVASTGTVTLSDLTSAISALSAGDIAGLAGAGITSIYATNGTLKLSAAQYEALGTTTIDSRDKVTISSNHSFVASNNVNNVTLVGNRNIDATGNSKANILIANSGNDHLNGMGGDDKLVTGTGHDTLTGGLGADRFVFADGKTGGNSFATADRITDFNHSEHDVIVLTGVSAIAGNSASAGEFTFIGDHSFSGHAGELRYEQVGGNTYIEGDTTGSGSAGFMIRVDGLHDFAASDFALNPLLL